MKDIHDRAMLVNLNISQWTARKHDRQASKEVADNHNASGDSDSIGRYNKVLIARDAIAKVGKIASRARHLHYTLTLPWFDKGARLLPLKMFDEYTAAMRDLESEFDAEVAKFVKAYPTLVDEARNRLNGLFCEDDYPTMGEIASRFEWDIELSQLPVTGDFRVALADDELERVRADMQRRAEERYRNAARDVWQRVHKAVEHIRDRMAEFDKKPGAKLHESVLGNLRDLVDILPSLNFDDDPELERIRSRLQSELCGIKTKDLKEKAAARADAKTKAAALLSVLRPMTQ